MSSKPATQIPPTPGIDTAQVRDQLSSAARLDNPRLGRRGDWYKVWVRLDAVLIVDPGMPNHVNKAGVEMRGEVPGTVTGWIPEARGLWLAVTDYSLAYTDGGEPLELHSQLVPWYAVRPRG